MSFLELPQSVHAHVLINQDPWTDGLVCAQRLRPLLVLSTLLLCQNSSFLRVSSFSSLVSLLKCWLCYRIAHNNPPAPRHSPEHAPVPDSMIRDPFGIHSKKKAFKATALRAAHEIKEAATQAGANALEMSFSLPKHVPDFGDPSRALEDRAWAALSRRGGGGGGGGKTGFFESSSDSLPMYKDKPYAYAPSMRLRPWWRRKKVLGTIAAAVMFVLYLMGFFSSDEPEAMKKKSSGSAFSWLGLSQEKGGVDWDERRKSVVEAFEVSWDAYERYAWGM